MKRKHRHRVSHKTPDPAIRESELERASLGLLCDLVVGCTFPYSDLSEYIENRAYDEWQRGNLDAALAEIQRVERFLAQLENKNEENTRDLADVYHLIGQLHQYAERYPESIEWLGKSIVIDDGNAVAYHTLGTSYLKSGDIPQAVRSFEQELAIDEGNYFTYLELAGLYEKEGEKEKAEACLKRLLERDQSNILGLHRLIRHYERHDPAINVGLLRKRLMSVERECSVAEAAIRVHYLCVENRRADALAFFAGWEKRNHPSPLAHLVRAVVFDDLKRPADRRAELDAFVSLCRSRQEVIHGYIEEFASIFGDNKARKIGAGIEKTR